MASSRILIVDDEQGVRSSVSAILRDEGFEVETAASGEECLGIVNDRAFEAILLDVWLPGKDGLDTLKSLRRSGVDASVIMISGHGTIETAVRATKLGAHDFVEKPLSLEKRLLTLRNALRAKKLEEKNRLLREELRRDAELVGSSAGIQRLREQIEQAAPTGAGVLILGEHGAGKELVARLVHARSPRSDEAFVEVPCSAIPAEAIIAELFGRAGAEGGGGRKGRLELASEGTIYLQEVEALPLEAQQRLLRALESGRFLLQDGHVALAADARPIAATTRDLAIEAAAGRFREDLYSKLSVVTMRVPPLRERGEDVALLVEHFLEKYAREYGRPRKRVEPAAMEALMRYGWPGNVRELRNLVERLAILTSSETISLVGLPPLFEEAKSGEPERSGEATTLRRGREEFEKRMILARLEATGWNITRTAASLGVERSNLYRKMKAYGIRSREPAHEREL